MPEAVAARCSTNQEIAAFAAFTVPGAITTCNALAGAQRPTRSPASGRVRDRQRSRLCCIWTGPFRYGTICGMDPKADTDLVAVARAYYAVLNAGGRDFNAYTAAMKIYLERHPHADDTEARRIVAALIAEASRPGLIWPMAPGWRGGRP
jgi:hypothetical protein